MTGDSDGRVPAVPAVPILLILLVAVTLRPALTSVGPVLPWLGDDEGLGETALGVLAALPLVAFALLSPLVHRWSGRIGIERTVVSAMIVLTLASVWRSYGGPLGLWVGTLLIGGAIAVGNVLVPAVIRRNYRSRVSVTTAVFSASMATAAGLASALAVPIAEATDWRFALAIWAVVSGIVCLAWLPGALRARARPAPVDLTAAHADTWPARSVWRRPDAWLVTAFMGLQSTCFYILVNWLPSIEEAAGIPLSVAGQHLLIYQVVGLFAGMAVPLFMRGDGQVTAAVGSAVPMVVAAVGLIVAPQLAVLWIFCAGVASGTALVVALSLIALRSRAEHETARLSGMAQSVGYGFAALGPIVAGYLAQLTGGWEASLLVVAALGVAQIAIGWAVGRAPKPRELVVGERRA